MKGVNSTTCNLYKLINMIDSDRKEKKIRVLWVGLESGRENINRVLDEL